MIKIDWVIVRSSTPARAAEFEFAVSELRRQLPDDARWLFGANVEQALNDEHGSGRIRDAARHGTLCQCV